VRNAKWTPFPAESVVTVHHGLTASVWVPTDAGCCAHLLPDAGKGYTDLGPRRRRHRHLVRLALGGSGAAAPSGALRAIDQSARPRLGQTFGRRRLRRHLSRPWLPSWVVPATMVLASRRQPSGRAWGWAVRPVATAQDVADERLACRLPGGVGHRGRARSPGESHDGKALEERAARPGSWGTRIRDAMSWPSL